MTATVETRPTAETDSDLMRVTVTTEDAAGTTREYEIGLSSDYVDDGYVMHGRRVDEDAPEAEIAGGGPSERAYEVAAERFKAAGYEVFGR